MGGFFPFGSGLTSKRRFLRYSASDMFDDNVRSRARIDNLVPFLTSDASSTTLVTSSTPATRNRAVRTADAANQQPQHHDNFASVCGQDRARETLRGLRRQRQEEHA